MALKLRVISDQYKQLGKDSSRLFGVTGGRIGRAPDNDWVLPDSERYVSSHHATVGFQGGQWILEDISTNGVFLNDSDTPLSVTGPRKLKDGDRVRFGDYDVLVSIDDRNDFSADASGQMPRPQGERSNNKAKSRHSSAAASDFGDDLGEELDITGLFMARVSEGHDDVLANFDDSPRYNHIPPSKAMPSSAPIVIDNAAEGEVDEPTLPTLGDESWHMTTRRLDARESSAQIAKAAYAPEPITPVAAPAPAAARVAPAVVKPTPPVAVPTKPAPAVRPEPSSPRRNVDGYSELQAGIEALCRGAGIDANALPTESQATLLTLAGQMLREVVLDLMEALKNRSEQKGRLESDHTTIQPNNNNPLKFSSSVDEALKKLLDGHSSRYVGPIEALREAFEDLRIHQVAIDAATQTAVEDLLHRLDPNELQERFDRGLKRSPLLGGGNKSKYWDLYTEFYPLLNQRDVRGLPAVFAQEFARSYADKLAEMENQKRK
ncbi:MAG: type VI secretion system-associated FHA domain protein TagH [Candidatus Obscuribacterales bacterium]|nr:type VI secretion system-associated FHA domain protein TagH [Steroidobacteraceae bacterium]